MNMRQQERAPHILCGVLVKTDRAYTTTTSGSDMRGRFSEG